MRLWPPRPCLRPSACGTSALRGLVAWEAGRPGPRRGVEASGGSSGSAPCPRVSAQRGSFVPGESGPSVLNTVAAPPFPDWPSAREDGAHARRGLPSCGRRRAAGEAALLGAGPWPAAACPSRAWGPRVHIAARLVPAQGVCGARTALETLHFNEIPSTRGCFPARLPCGSASSVLREWQVGGRSLVQGHPPVGCRPRGEGMSVGVSAGHDGAVKGGPQRSAWPVLPRRPRIVICVWVSLGTG